MKDVVATKPRVIESNGKNGWYVYFSVKDPLTGKMCPVKIERGFRKCTTDEERKAWGKKLVREYTKKLKAGWTPWHQDDKIYDDEIVYKNEGERFGVRRKGRACVRLCASEFLQYKAKSLKPKTLSSYKSKMRIFCLWLEHNDYGEYDISAIDNKIILEFFNYVTNERDLDKVTVKTYQIKIHAFFDYLIKNRYVLSNPVHDIPAVRKKRDMAPRRIFKGDLRHLLETIKTEDPQLYLGCMMQFYCAIRPGTELRLLKIKHIDFWGRTIVINSLDAKNAHEEGVSIPEQLLALLTDVYHLQNYDPEMYVFGKHGIPGHKPLGKNNMRNRFNKFRDSLGLSRDYKYYSFKHTGASTLIEAGFNITEIMQHLRHSDIESTYHYIRRRKGNSSREIQENFPDPY